VPEKSNTKLENRTLFMKFERSLRDLNSFISRVALALEAAAFGGPIHKPLHVIAVFPGEVKKLASRQIVRFLSEKGLKPPPHVRTFPRFQAVAPGRVPVVTQSLKHFLAVASKSPSLLKP